MNRKGVSKMQYKTNQQQAAGRQPGVDQVSKIRTPAPVDRTKSDAFGRPGVGQVSAVRKG